MKKLLGGLGPSYKGRRYLPPKCSNLADNISDGFWRERGYVDVEVERKYYDDLYTKFRVEHEGDLFLIVQETLKKRFTALVY